MSELPTKGQSEQAEEKAKAPDAKSDKIEMLIAALVKINQSNRKADNAEHKRTDRREKRNFWLHIAEIILIVVYATFTGMEWNTFNTESKIMAQEFTSSQTNNVQQLAVLQGQLNEMKNERNLEQRAWMSPYLPDNSMIQVSNGLACKVIIKNTGRTPAVVTGSFIGFTDNTNGIPFTDPIIPKCSMFFAPDASDNLSTPNLTLKALEDIRDSVPIYIYGFVDYDDIFGNHHFTQFCWTVVGQFVEAGPFHNSCDDMQTNQNN